MEVKKVPPLLENADYAVHVGEIILNAQEQWEEKEHKGKKWAFQRSYGSQQEAEDMKHM